MLRTLTARLVLLVAAVALAGSVLTTFAFTKVIGGVNQDTARQAMISAADQAEARIQTRLSTRPAYPPGDLLFVRTLRSRGYTVQIVADNEAAAVPGPFQPDDVTAAADGTDPVQRTVNGQDWLIVSRPIAGARALLVGRKVAETSQLTPDQRRRALLGGALGLGGGVLAGLIFAFTITRPLGRLAGAARRLTAGERDIVVPAEGPAEIADVAHALGALSTALAVSEQRQRRFLLAVSHELRTPLTAVAGYAEALQDGAIPAAEVPHAASVIAGEAARLQRRVEDLMALARLDADDFRLVAAPTDVGALIRAAYAAFAPRAAESGVALGVQVPPVGPVVVADGERLRQAVDALADNALKVLPPGAPLVLACLPTVDGGVRVEVRDGGPGLAPEDLAVAFERGLLTERYRGQRKVGSGVGLALVGELARRMGGAAEALAAPEGGVCFAVTLPAHPPATSQPLPTVGSTRPGGMGPGGPAGPWGGAVAGPPRRT